MFPASAIAGSYSRRCFIGGTGVAFVASVAGCGSVLNFIGGFLLDEVTLFNESAAAVDGTIDVRDPAAETILSEDFSLEPPADDQDDDDTPENTATYSDVFTKAGTYSVEIDVEGDAIGEVTVAEEVTVDDIEDEHIIVGFDIEDADEAVVVGVIENFTDLGEIT